MIIVSTSIVLFLTSDIWTHLLFLHFLCHLIVFLLFLLLLLVINSLFECADKWFGSVCSRIISFWNKTLTNYKLFVTNIKTVIKHSITSSINHDWSLPYGVNCQYSGTCDISTYITSADFRFHWTFPIFNAKSASISSKYNNNKCLCHFVCVKLLSIQKWAVLYWINCIFAISIVSKCSVLKISKEA